MNNTRFTVLGAVLGLVLVSDAPLSAQQHRATRLGNPATRFAPPLRTAEDLRQRFRDARLRPDIAEVLRQWRWGGDVEDLYRAAETGAVAEVMLPVGTRMPFMSSREGGRPVALIDVLWAGKEPVAAYAFAFSSKGRRYRCVTPKPCSNFYVEDLGGHIPQLQLAKSAPADVRLCEPFESVVTVRNLGQGVLTRVGVRDALPAGLKTPSGLTDLALDAGSLAPGEGREFRIRIVPERAGTYLNTARATCAEGAAVLEASARTRVHASGLALQCQAPAHVLLGRPVEVCLALRNTGTLPEPRSVVTLPIPAGTAIRALTQGGTAADGHAIWLVTNLIPQASRRLCAVFDAPAAGTLAFTASAQGACEPPAQSQCATRVAGVPGILLEVVDLEDPIEVGQQTTYVIKVRNQGTAPLTQIRLECTLAASQAFVSGTGATAVRAQDRILTMAPLAALAPKTEAAWRVVVKTLQAGDVRFQTELRCDEFSRPVQETEATQQY
ncbi:MAG: DUF11 domain-containing protein [Verrucomicrobia bacterium]|nr:DUF11 domain-containing protein [Verrucomicrobiota bacterium]